MPPTHLGQMSSFMVQAGSFWDAAQARLQRPRKRGAGPRASSPAILSPLPMAGFSPYKRTLLEAAACFSPQEEELLIRYAEQCPPPTWCALFKSPGVSRDLWNLTKHHGGFYTHGVGSSFALTKKEGGIPLCWTSQELHGQKPWGMGAE